jgi:hypothetical protein
VGRRAAVHGPGVGAPPRRGGGLTARWPAVLLLLVLLGACADPVAGPATGGNSLAGLDRAVAEVDRTRSALLAVPGEVVPVVSLYDDADDAAARGDRAAARAAEQTAAAGTGRVRAAFDALPARTADYRAALRELAAQAGSAPGLTAQQRGALSDVAAAGEQEAAAVEAAVTAARDGWPAYEGLGEALRTWLQRAQAGWFRTTAEAAGGYATVVAGVRPRLEQAREALARTDAERLAAVDRQNARLEAADRALAPLRAPS